MDSLWTFLLIWGVWLITPVLVDGFEAISRLAVVKTRSQERSEDEQPLEDSELPTVTVIVPAHNEAAVIDRCINSVKAQDYPSDKMEVIVIDDGSTDGTAERVEEHVNSSGASALAGDSSGSFLLRGKPIKVGNFPGKIELIRNGHNRGKAVALNAGIAASTGEIIINIDSDVVLAHDTVRNIATAFERRPEMGAATGNIEIDWEVLEERDENGDLVFDENADLITRQLSWGERFLAQSQFLEYLASFALGRRSQAITQTMYTLAGACSAFRRSVIAGGTDYNNVTVSEDTCLTFDLHRMGVQVGFVDDAKVYLEPVIDWDSLYAQRVRWTRGQLEVCGLNKDLIGKRRARAFGRFAVPKMLLFDHTLAFPRLIWAPLLLFFPFIGYSLRIVAIALLGMYIFYLLLEIVNTMAVFAIADEDTRDRIEKSSWTLLGLPIYRFIVFHFRFSGFLVTLKEEQEWTTTGPMIAARGDLHSLQLRSVQFISMLTTLFIAVGVWVSRNAQMILPPALMGVLFSAVRWFNSDKKW